MPSESAPTTPEECELLDLLVNLIRGYEATAFPARYESKPHETLAFLLEQREIGPKDLWPVLVSKGRVSEILAGKRSISKDQAKKLTKFSDVGVGLFI
jgi:HTH-type transcriptional regulator/antitoxin HigA